MLVNLESERSTIERRGFNARPPEQLLREPRTSDHLRRRRFADFLPPEKKDVTLPARKNRLTKVTAVNVARIVDNDWRCLPILDANVCPFDSASVWALSTPACSPCNNVSAAGLILSVSISLSATPAVTWPFRESGVSSVSLFLFINAFNSYRPTTRRLIYSFVQAISSLLGTRYKCAPILGRRVFI
jgi:hypothetical protein